MSRRFLLTIVTLAIIGVTAAVAIFLAKGYRLQPKEGGIAGTGILSVTSIPDQASVYLDGHLTTATNTNINSLPPQSYQVKIVKEGFIPWEKKLEVKEGLVTEVKATLFRAIPSVYPLTYSGAENVLLSPDEQKLVFVVPPPTDGNVAGTKRSGIWVWQMSEQPIAFNRGGEPRQIALTQSGIDYTKATLKWSPDSNQILISLPDRQLLLSVDRLNDPPRDITATFQSILKDWLEAQRDRDLARLSLIKDLTLRKVASTSAILKWAPDETKFFYSQGDKDNFKVVDLVTQKSYDLPKATSFSWLPTSEHIILIEKGDNLSRISIIEYDGANIAEIYAGNFNTNFISTWPDSSRVVIVSSLPIATASQPNLYGINLK